MLAILYPTGLNWFYESVARAMYDDLVTLGVPVQLLTAPQLMEIAPDELGPGSDLLIVNFYESAQSMVAPGFAGYCREHFELLRKRVSAFDRRILVNLDSIYTDWFRMHMDTCQSALTDIFDLTMLPQTDHGMLAGCRYTWIPECLTIAQEAALRPYDDAKSIPWAMIGHATPPRAAVADQLLRGLGSDGFIFLLGLRPSRGDGSRNLTPAELFRVLSHTRYYVWSTHHGYPYHEGLRAINAICNGAVPAKIEKAFSLDFADVPWVYPDVKTLLHTIEEDGPAVMFEKAAAFVRSRGTTGKAVARALGIAVTAQASLGIERTGTTVVNTKDAAP